MASRVANLSDRVRVTVSVDPEVLDVYRTMASAAGISLSYCLGEWLADTIDGAQMVASKMQEAKQAPIRVMREMQSILHGAHQEAGEILGKLRVEGVRSAVAQAGVAPRQAITPPSNTGGNSPPRTRRKR